MRVAALLQPRDCAFSCFAFFIQWTCAHATVSRTVSATCDDEAAPSSLALASPQRATTTTSRTVATPSPGPSAPCARVQCVVKRGQVSPRRRHTGNAGDTGATPATHGRRTQIAHCPPLQSSRSLPRPWQTPWQARRWPPWDLEAGQRVKTSGRGEGAVSQQCSTPRRPYLRVAARPLRAADGRRRGTRALPSDGKGRRRDGPGCQQGKRDARAGRARSRRPFQFTAHTFRNRL